VVSAGIPLLVFAAVMVVLSARNERAVFERGAIERTRALITAVDAELKSSIATLEALATSRQFDRGDLRGV
jgi:CHASE1-domain containing sensor protein